MAKKVKINLTFSKNELWWSADSGINWAVVSANSPVTVLKKDYELQWISEDDTISDIEISLDGNNKVLDPPDGSKKAKESKVKSSAQNGDKTKYSIMVTTKSAGVFTADPEAKYCDPPCPPGDD